MSEPFLVLGLPRSRTAWMARFLSYGGWHCGHEETRHLRSLDDARAWLSQPLTGSCETAIAPFWRLIPDDVKVVIIRRDPTQVIESLMAIPGLMIERDSLTQAIHGINQKLDQIAARRPGVLSVAFDELVHENTCAKVFEHCLGLPHDPAHWTAWAPINVQCDMVAMMRYAVAYAPSLHSLARVAKHRMLKDMVSLKPVASEGMTFQVEDFATWFRDARALIDDHLVIVGEAPGDQPKKNLGLMADLDRAGAMQIVTARSNGRMFGYLMTLVTPSLAHDGKISATNMTFYAAPECPGLGLKIQRQAIQLLNDRGVHEVFFEAGKRGDGPRLDAMYRRLGAQEHGHSYRIELEAA